MKRILLATVLLCGTAFSANAFDAWQGDLFITSVNAACDAASIKVGDYFRSTYLPAGVGVNPNETRLSFIGPRTAQQYHKSGLPYGNGTWEAARITGLTAFLTTFEATMTKAKSQPATPTETTQTVVLSGILSNFFDTPDCKVAFRGSLGHQVVATQ
jgi:hypothetical protein